MHAQRRVELRRSAFIREERHERIRFLVCEVEGRHTHVQPRTDLHHSRILQEVEEPGRLRAGAFRREIGRQEVGIGDRVGDGPPSPIDHMTSSAIVLRDALAALLDQPHARVLGCQLRRADDVLGLA